MRSSEWPENAGRIVSGIGTSTLTVGEDSTVMIKKVKIESRTKALELMGKHVKIKAFDTTLDIDLLGGIAQLSTDEYKKARSELIDGDDC